MRGFLLLYLLGEGKLDRFPWDRNLSKERSYLEQTEP